MTTKQAKSETLSGAKAPERIYLQWFGVDAADVTPEELAIQPSPGDLTWCTDKQFDTDVEYIRADVGRLQGLEEAAEIADELTTVAEKFRQFREFQMFAKVAAAIREKIAGEAVGAQEEKQ